MPKDAPNHLLHLPQELDESPFPSPMNSIGESPSHLQNLPQELFEWTAEFLPSEDLFNLRLTCKDMAARTTKLMARTYFKELYVLMMDAASMARLIEVCMHPAFNKAIKVIKFNIAVLEDEENNYHINLFEPGDERDEPWTTWITTKEQQEMYDQHICFREHVKTCIGLIFDYCHRAGIMPEIRTLAGGFYSEDSSFQVPYGTKRLERELGGRRLNLGFNNLEQKAYSMMCYGLFASDLEISRLTLGHHSARFDPWTLAEAMNEFENYMPFRNLTHLDLSLTDHRVSSWVADVPGRLSEIKTSVNAFQWLILQAESLESLVLNCYNEYLSGEKRAGDVVFFNSLVKECLPFKPLQGIKHLRLQGHDIPKRMLLDFVREYASTLRSLELWEIIDGKRDDKNIKNDLFGAAEDIPDFKLRMGRVYEGTRKAVYSNHKGWAPPVWESLDLWGKVIKVD